MCVVQWNRKCIHGTDVVHLQLHLMCWPTCWCAGQPADVLANLLPPIHYPNMRISELGYYTTNMRISELGYYTTDHGTLWLLCIQWYITLRYVQLPKLATFCSTCFLPFLATIGICIRTTLVQFFFTKIFCHFFDFLYRGQPVLIFAIWFTFHIK